MRKTLACDLAIMDQIGMESRRIPTDRESRSTRAGHSKCGCWPASRTRRWPCIAGDGRQARLIGPRLLLAVDEYEDVEWVESRQIYLGTYSCAVQNCDESEMRSPEPDHSINTLEGDADDGLDGYLDDVEDHEPPVPEQYTFDPTDVARAAAVLDSVFKNLITGWDGWGAVDKAVEELDQPLSGGCTRVLGKIAARPLKLDHDGNPGVQLSDGNGFGIVTVSEVEADDVLLWVALVDTVTAPGAVARLSDLLFVRRDGKPGEHALRAIAGYLAAIGDQDNDLNCTKYLLRAWHLCRLIRNTALETRCRAEIEKRVDVLIAGDGMSRPGVLFPLVEAMCTVPLEIGRAPAAKTRIDSVLAIMASTESRGYLASRIAALRRKILGSATSDEQRRAIDLDELDGYVRSADEANHPATLMAHLEAAAKLATRRGLVTQTREIAARMQAIPVEDLQGEVIRSSTTLPDWIPESLLERFTRGLDWREGMAEFLLDPEPPSGKVSIHRDYAVSNRNGLRRLLRTVITGTSGLPRATLSQGQEEDLNDMAFSSRVHAEFQGRMLLAALTRISTSYGVPDVSELATFISECGARDKRLALSLAKGFRYFWDGDYEAAIAIVTPKIEAAARGLLCELDEGIYRVQKNKDPGGYPGLYVLLNELGKLGFDEDWSWFLKWLLLGPTGMNIRNEISHGFVSDLRPEYAVLILRAASLLFTSSPVSDEFGRRIDVLPQLRPLSGAARRADAVLQAVVSVSSRVHSLGMMLRIRLRRGVPV